MKPTCKVCGCPPFLASKGVAGANNLHEHFFGRGMIAENRHAMDACHGGCPGQRLLAEQWCPDRFEGGVAVPAHLSPDEKQEYLRKVERELAKTHVLCSVHGGTHLWWMQPDRVAADRANYERQASLGASDASYYKIVEIEDTSALFEAGDAKARLRVHEEWRKLSAR